jgi:hypothetical protein
MGLSALQIEHAKAGAKLYRLFDGEGLFIEITPTGAKRWRVKYLLNGRERRLSLGMPSATWIRSSSEWAVAYFSCQNGVT